MRVMGFFIYILVGYLCGMMLSSIPISMDLSKTEWANVWVYMWIGLWPLMVLGTFLYYIAIIGIFVGLVYLAYKKLVKN
jgi:hypothetical protein